jgi:hypothetical protein
MQRSVQPEILDGLPACHVDALSSRKDLVTINFLMGNFRWLGRQVRSLEISERDRLLEIGAGDGSLAGRLIPGLEPGSYHALDQCSAPENWPTTARWHAADLLSFSEYGEYSHLLANLILHHFDAGELADLGTRIRRSGIRHIIACEPCRRPVHKWQLRAGQWIGFNYVTLNDGCVSIDAGFRSDDLPQLLGLVDSEWSWSVEESWMGAYRLRADKK